MTRALLKTAVRLWRNDMAPRSVRRANARKWLAATQARGDNHILHPSRPPVRWGTQQGSI